VNPVTHTSLSEKGGHPCALRAKVGSASTRCPCPRPSGFAGFSCDRLAECSQILSTHFRDVWVYRLEAPECVRYKQVVVIGARRSRREKERLTDSDITRARLYYASLARNPSQIPVLPSEPESRYNVPVSGPAQLVYRGLLLDEIENLLPLSAACWRHLGSRRRAEPIYRGSPRHRAGDGKSG